MSSLFPYGIIRVAGNTLQQLEHLKLKDTDVLIRKYLACDSFLEDQNESISSTLLEFIKDCDQPSMKGILINLRRDLYNQKITDIKRLEDFSNILPEQLRKKIHQYISSIFLKKELEENIDQVYNAEFQEIRKEFKALTLDPNLQNGLLLSANSLYDGLQKYINKPITEFRKKERQTEMALYKYLSRLHTRTIPFSTFTHVGFFNIKEEKNDVSITIDEGLSFKSHMMLNNFMFKYIKGLLIHIYPIYSQLLIKLNNTIDKQDGNYAFLTTSNNIDVFQKVGANPFIDLIQDIIKEEKEGIVYQELVYKISQREDVDAKEETIVQWMNKLIKIGLLEIQWDISELTSDWNAELIRWLKKIKQQANKEIIDTLLTALEHIEENKRIYEIEDSSIKRKKILIDIFREFRQVCVYLQECARFFVEEKNKQAPDKKSGTDSTTKKSITKFEHINNTAFRFKPEQILYEDCIYKNEFTVQKAMMNQITSSLSNLISFVQSFESSLKRGKGIKNFFLSQYEENDEVSFIKFYQDFTTTLKEKPLSTYMGKEIDILEDSVVDFLLSSVAQKDNCVFFDTQLIEKCKEQFEIQNTKNRLPSSYSALLQIVEGEDPYNCVVNDFHPGFGKLYSRFIAYAPADFLEKLKSFNTEHSNGQAITFAEITDTFCFNGDVHPLLMPNEITVPNGNSRSREQKQISIMDLVVSYNKEKGLIELKNNLDGKIVYPFDLGFLAYSQRAPLSRLLMNFSLAHYSNGFQLINKIQAGLRDTTNTDVVILPRIIYDQAIVLKRKTWLFSKKGLPMKSKNEKDCEYLIKIRKWQQQHNLPDDIFCYTDNKRTKFRSKPYSKPQYISFQNPISIKILAKTMNACIHTLKIVEMLPNSKQVARIGNEQRASELIITWYE